MNYTHVALSLTQQTLLLLGKHKNNDESLQVMIMLNLCKHYLMQRGQRKRCHDESSS